MTCTSVNPLLPLFSVIITLRQTSLSFHVVPICSVSVQTVSPNALLSGYWSTAPHAVVLTLILVMLCIPCSTDACSESSTFVVEFSQFWKLLSEILRCQEIIHSLTQTNEKISRLQKVQDWHGLCRLYIIGFYMIRPVESHSGAR